MNKFVDDIKATFPGNNDVTSAMTDSTDNFGQLDCLINNAALYDEFGPFKSECELFDRTFMVNVLAPFIITKRVLTEMNV